MISAQIFELLQIVHGDCVYPGHVPDGPKYPVVVFALASHEKSKNIDASTSKPGASFTRFDVDVLAKTYITAEATAKSIIDAYDGWGGAVGGVDISLIQIVADGAAFEDNDKIWAIPLTFSVSY